MRINKTLTISNLKNDNLIALELSRSSQQWLEIVPGSSLDSPELAPTCKWSSTPKGGFLWFGKSGSV